MSISDEDRPNTCRQWKPNKYMPINEKKRIRINRNGIKSYPSIPTEY